MPTGLADNRVFEGHAFALVQQVENFLRANLQVASTLPKGEFRRQDRPSFPWGAMRAGVINARVHRDDSAYDGGVSLTLSPLRFEVWNPRSLPEGLSGEELPFRHISRPHHPDIAHVFFLRGLIEGIGIGARRIVTECREAAYSRRAGS
jgi:ATP-dependent DNA helicase RecG